MASVYAHKHGDTVFYIGISSKDFNGNANHRAYNTTNRSKFHKSITAKYETTVEILHNFISLDMAFLLEKAYIAAFGRRDLGTGSLVNLTNGGEGNDGVSMGVFVYEHSVLISYYNSYTECAKALGVSISLVAKAANEIHRKVGKYCLIHDESYWTIEEKLEAITANKISFCQMRRNAQRKNGELGFQIKISLGDFNLKTANMYELVDTLCLTSEEANVIKNAIKKRCKKSLGYSITYL